MSRRKPGFVTYKTLWPQLCRPSTANRLPCDSGMLCPSATTNRGRPRRQDFVRFFLEMVTKRMTVQLPSREAIRRAHLRANANILMTAPLVMNLSHSTSTFAWRLPLCDDWLPDRAGDFGSRSHANRVPSCGSVPVSILTRMAPDT